MSYSYPPQYAYPSAPPMYRAFPAPPRLHWAWVLVLSVVTVGIFAMIWMVVQAWWVKKIIHDAWPFGWSVAYLLSLPTLYLTAFAGGVLLSVAHRSELVADFIAVLVPTFRFSIFIFYIMAAFTLRGALQAEPINIPLSGGMTFFFGPTYFQYHLHDYNVEGRVAEQLTGFEEPALTVAPAAMDVAEFPPQI